MDCARIAAGVILVTLVAGGMGYAIASAVLTFKDLGFSADIDFAYIAQSYLVIRDRRPDDFQLINLIIGGAAVAGLMMSLALSGSALTRFGQTPWQDGQPKVPRKVYQLEGLSPCADRSPHRARQDDRLCHSEPAKLAGVSGDTGCEGRML